MSLAKVPAVCLAICLGLTPGPAAQAAGPGDQDKMFVVALKRPPDGDVARVTAQAAAMTRRYGGQVHHVYASALRGFSVTVSGAQAARLAADRRVAMVERNQVFATQAVASWGLDRINQRRLPLDGVGVRAGSAAGVTAYVVDSGLRISHREFGGRARYGYDAVDSDSNADDCYGHGTHVAGILGGSTYGVAKDVDLVGVRVLDCSGYGTTATIVAGIDWVTQHARRPAVVNMSLESAYSLAIDRALKSSIDSGIPYVVSAGNQGGDACAGSPSDVPEAITVGATTRDDARAPFSNAGSCVDLFAPGVDIRSAWFTDDKATYTLRGTSMAAPHVTGAAAVLLAAHPRATPGDIAGALLDASTKDVISGLDGDSPNRLLHVEDADDRR